MIVRVLTDAWTGLANTVTVHAGRAQQYVLTQPNTLLVRFYGLHRVKLPGGRKIHYVVMENVFPPNRDMHETYDLKVRLARIALTRQQSGVIEREPHPSLGADAFRERGTSHRDPRSGGTPRSSLARRRFSKTITF